MRALNFQPLRVSILCFIFLPQIAFASPEEDMAAAEKLYYGEDIKEATKFYKLAADQNYLPAQVRLGELMYGSTDYEESFGWFLTAAFQGDAAGQYNLGQMYSGGFGVEQNYNKALYWVKKAAEQDYLEAVQMLALSYRVLDKNGNVNNVKNDLGVTPNQEQADFWSAKLPELEKIAAKKLKRLEADRAKKAAEAAAEKAKKNK